MAHDNPEIRDRDGDGVVGRPRWPASAKVATAVAGVVALLAVGASAVPDRPAEGVAVGAAAAAAPSTTSEPRSSEANDTTTTAAPATTVGAPAAGDVAVRSITDGDTLVLADGRRVRLAQVDAPETSECFGTESTVALSTLAAGKTVTLRRPPTGPATDRYGRTLADIYVGSVSVNEALVRNGDAEWYESFAGEDADLAGRLRAAEAEARAAGRGLWSACGVSAPAATSARPAAGGGAECHPAYPDDCIPPPSPDLNCGDIARRVGVDHRYGDPHGFDRDKDGWGCESYG